MAETVNHTPGPWKFDPISGEVNMDDGDVEALVATINLENVNEHTGLADGWLVAASTDLIGVLREAIPFLETIARNHHPAWRPEMADSDSVLGRAYAAIAKAEGRS